MDTPKHPRTDWAVLLCHPHPQFGGTMHNKVIFRAGRALQGCGLPTLRFNFRGVEKSAGTYDEGRGEKDDVRYSLDFLYRKFSTAKLCLLGFSFGAWVGLQVGIEDPRVQALIGLGLPLNVSDMNFLCDSPKPKLIVQGTRDEFGPKERAQELFDRCREPKQFALIEDAPHLFTGKVEPMMRAVESFANAYLL